MANIGPVTRDTLAFWYESNVAGPVFGTPADVEKKRRHIRLAALSFADKIIRDFPGILAGPPDGGAGKILRALMTCEHADLEGHIYAIRDRELEGWDGPAVKAWGDAISAANNWIKENPK